MNPMHIVAVAYKPEQLAALQSARTEPIVLLPEGRSMQAFKVGDVVRLKSGGPPMTIVNVDDKDYVVVGWHDVGEIKAQPISPDALEKCAPAGRLESAVDEALVR